MTTYYLSYEDYKEYFNEETEIKEDEYDYIMVRVEGINNEEDREWEYSISWKCLENDESGNKYGINTSSIWSLMSCNWYEMEEESEEEEDEGFSEE